MPRKLKKRKPHTQPKRDHGAVDQDSLIAVQGATIVVHNSGDANVNGLYTHKCLDDDYFERVSSVQAAKHGTNDNDDNNDNDVQLMSAATDTQECKQNDTSQKGKYEIDRHEYLKNPDDIPHASLNKSGVWILSRVDVYPKRMLYAVNCPFKSKIAKKGWVCLTDGVEPAPMIKLMHNENEEQQHSHKPPRKKQKQKQNQLKETADDVSGNIRDVIRHIQAEHHNDPAMRKMKPTQSEKQTFARNADRLMIISGGQTGVDRAALDVAKAMNITYGGWIPKGRLAEDGVIDAEQYANLKECDSEEMGHRTLLNVIHSDATLILNMGALSDGTLTTKKFVSQKNKDMMYITFNTLTIIANESEESEEKKEATAAAAQQVKDQNEETYADMLGFSDGRAQRVAEWIRCANVRVLNIAGPRESKRNGVYAQSVQFLNSVLHNFKNGDIPKQSLFL